MAGIATVVLITTINLRMVEPVSLFVAAGLLHPSPPREWFRNVAERSHSRSLPLDITTLKIGGRGHGIDRNLDSFPPFRFHSSSRPSPFFVLQTNRSIRSFVLSLLPPPPLSILCLSRVTTDRQNGSNWMQIGNDCNPITGYLISHPFAGGRTLKNTRIG